MKMKNKILAGVVLMGLASSSLVFAQPSGTPPNNNTPDANFNSVTVDATMITEDGELTNKKGVIGVKAILDVVANTGIKIAVGSFVNSGSGYGLFASAVDVAVYAVTSGSTYAGYFRNSGTGPALYAFSSANVGVQAYGGGAGTGGRFSAASGNVAYLATPNNSVEVNGAISPTVATNPLVLGNDWSGTISDTSNAILLNRPMIVTPTVVDGTVAVGGQMAAFPEAIGTVSSSFATNCGLTGGEAPDGTTCRWPLMVNNGYSVVRAISGGIESVLHITKTGKILNPSNQFGGAVNIDDNLTVTGEILTSGIKAAGADFTIGVNTQTVKIVDDLEVTNNDHGLLSSDYAKDADGWFTCPNGYYAIGVRVTSTNTVNGLRCAEL